MRVALVYNSYESVSGESVFFSNMVRGMRERGIDVIDCPVPQARPGTFAGAFDHYLRFPLLHRAGSAIARAKGADVIHLMNAALAPALRRGRIPCVATAHFTPSSYLELAPPASAAARMAERLYCAYSSALDSPAIGRLDGLVACSPFQAGYLRAQHPAEAEKISFIAPGIDAEFFRGLPREDLCGRYGCEAVAVFAGRLHERSKGVSLLIDALRVIRSKGDLDMKLLIVGEGPDRGRYQRQIRRSDLDGKALLLGKLDFREKSIIQRSADVAAVPSSYEVFGTVFAEYLACGVPVAAFDLPFWRGLYDGAGVFVRPKDSAALARGLEALICDRPLRRKTIIAGKRIADSFDFSRTLDQYASLYEKIAR